MHFHGVESDRSAGDARLDAQSTRVEVHRHRHIDQPVAGEDLQAGVVRVDDQALLAGSERGRNAMAMNRESRLRAS